MRWTYLAPPEFMLNILTYYSMKYMTLWPFLSARTHTYSKDPTKWIYTFWLNYPTKWVYKFEQVLYMTEYYNLHHRSQPFSSNYTYDFFITNIKKTSREIKIQNHHNANNALHSARLMLPLKLCIQCILSIWPKLLLSLCNLNTFNIQSSRHIYP